MKDYLLRYPEYYRFLVDFYFSRRKKFHTKMNAALYGPPPNVAVPEALNLIFGHYCSPWKSSYATEEETALANVKTMDGASFARMCREAPELDQFVSRSQIDLIFSKAKPQGVRRIDFDHFLEALLSLSTKVYPDEVPTIALANFLARFIFALFDQPPSPDGVNVIENIIRELSDNPEELLEAYA